MKGVPEARFLAWLTGFCTIRIQNQPSFLKPTPGVCNKQEPSSLGGPPDWVVVPEGTTSIPILGQLLSQDDVEDIRTSLTIPEGYFTECRHGVEDDKSGVDPSTN